MDRSSLIIAPIIGEMEDFKLLFGESLSSSNLLLQQVVAHIRQKSGKMMRPMLVLLAAKLLGGVKPATLHAAASLELLHTASLVHDDVVDDSTERRGQLSVNALFNNKVAVLTGDYLLATALVQAGLTRNLGIIDLISALGRELAEGELLQLSNVRNEQFSEDVYFEVRTFILKLFTRRRQPSLPPVRRQEPCRWTPMRRKSSSCVVLVSISAFVSKLGTTSSIIMKARRLANLQVTICWKAS